VQVISTDANAQDEMAKFSPDGSQVAFYRPGKTGWDLWVANADMSEARNLGVYTQFGEIPVVWSPDGSKIAFPSGMKSLADAAVVTVASGEVTYLLETPAFEIPIEFTADGSEVVFAAYTDGTTFKGGIVPLDGGGARWLLPADVEGSYVGSLSPDGTQVAFLRPEGGGRINIWVADASGENLRQLTTEGYEAFTGNQSPWSPDGTMLIYASSRTGRSDLWTVRVADGAQRQLTSDIRDDLEGTWSPDGSSVAFISTRGRQRDVWVVPVAGGDPVRVTDDPAEEEHLSWRVDGELVFSAGGSPGSFWRRSLADGAEARISADSLDPGNFALSPDRSQIAFSIDLPSGDRDVAVMPTEGGAWRVLATGGNNVNYRWSPDGTQIAFTSNRSGNLDVWLVPADGSAPAKPLTDWPSNEAPQFWSGDGSALVVRSDRDVILADLWHLPVDGGEAVRLTTLGNAGGASRSPTFGVGEMVYSALGDDGGSFWTMKLSANGEIEPFFEGTSGVNASTLTWSPDGSTLAMYRTQGGAPRLEVRSGDGKEVLVTLEGDYRYFDFSPDGTKLLTTFFADGSREVGILDVATGVHTRMTETPENETDAAFTADGRSIIMRRVFVSQRVMVADVSALVGPSGE
jgi:TolB protein